MGSDLGSMYEFGMKRWGEWGEENLSGEEKVLRFIRANCLKVEEYDEMARIITRQSAYLYDAGIYIVSKRTMDQLSKVYEEIPMPLLLNNKEIKALEDILDYLRENEADDYESWKNGPDYQQSDDHIYKRVLKLDEVLERKVKKTILVGYIEGGVLHTLKSNIEINQVEIIDIDNAEEIGNADEMEEKWNKLSSQPGMKAIY